MMDAVMQGLGLVRAKPPVQLGDASLPVLTQGLTLRYPGRQQSVLDDLNWQLPAGQVVGLLGRNGAGKTSLIEALLGLRDPWTGRALLYGQEARQIDDVVRARIGYVPQQSDLFPQLTPRQLLNYFRSFYPRWNTAKVEGLMSRWAIPAEQTIAELSGGQQQRLSIIRALAHEPDLLVLDEPVSSLDPLGRRDFLRELVEQVLDCGTTVLFSTHILSDLERVAFQVAFLKEGRIGLQAPLDELLEACRWQREPLPPGARCLAQHGERQLIQAAPGQGLEGEAVTLEDLFEALT
ncbi:ABC transporter ATP-binding protein [Inhella inkyongensis]|nr:ABC transporter ATP-binding protein [Inhella inkyongensis]